MLLGEGFAMYGTFFKIVAKAGKVGELIEFLRWDAAVAKAAEPDTRRFDVWNVPGEPDAVFVYEAYTNQLGFLKHQNNQPFKRYVSYVEPLLLEPGRRMDMFGFTDSLASNDDLMWRTEARLAGTARPSSGGVARLSIASFPPDTDALVHFNDYAELRRLTPVRNASVVHVHFPPGVRTDWHYHNGEQLLWFIDGEGEVAFRDSDSTQAPIICLTGDIIQIPAGASHWHGASLEHSAIHIAITTGETVWQERPADPHGS